jgi:signal transduction histidine kinase
MTRRLVISAEALVVLLLLLIGIPFLRTVEKFERERLRLDLIHDAVVLGAGVEDELSGDSSTNEVTQADAREYATRTGARVVIVDKTGIVRADSASATKAIPGKTTTGKANNDVSDLASRSMASRPEFVQALRGNFAAVTRKSNTLGFSSLYVAVPVSSAGQLYGAVRVSFPTSAVDRRIAVQRTRLIGAGLLIALAVGLLGALLARWLAKPIAALQSITRDFGAGARTARAQTNVGPSDVRKLANEFNTMADRIDEFVSVQHAFVADASHELRSPLTAIRLQLEAMEFGSASEVDQRRSRALDEVNRLSRNVDGLLVLANQSVDTRKAVRINISELTNNRADFWRSLIEEHGITLASQIEPNLFCEASADHATTVLDNLIANAIDAAPEGSMISIIVDAHPDAKVTKSSASHGIAIASASYAVIRIIDQGSGMSNDQRVAAFDRFWRASSKRSALSGSGLGLAIARKLVVADHGTIRLDAAAPTGIEAVVSYPLCRALKTAK